MTIAASKSSKITVAKGLPAKKSGSGQPSIVCPMETYISAAKKNSEAMSRRFRSGVSLSASRSSVTPPSAAAPFSTAPYPAASTAAMTAAGDASPSTPMELVSRLTAQDDTPGVFATAFSTRATQAAQLMPVTA